MSRKIGMEIRLDESRLRNKEDFLEVTSTILSCFRAPKINEVTTRCSSEPKAKIERRDGSYFTIREVKDFISSCNENLEYVSFNGALFIGPYFPLGECLSISKRDREYTLGKVTKIYGPNIGWSGGNPSYYMYDDGEHRATYNNPWPEEPQLVPFEIVHEQVYNTIRCMIQKFKPLAFCIGEGIIQESYVLYYKNPYFFCIGEEESNLAFISDEDTLKKVEEIKKVLPLEELREMIKKYSSLVKHEVFETEEGGICIFNELELALYPLYFIRKAIRERGVKLKAGKPEEVAEWYKKEGIQVDKYENQVFKGYWSGYFDKLKQNQD